ncbi:yersiniabactin salicyl-AMP ligase [Ruminiclostridium sufflavum DSM 19573]|uniref:Yersiniabactin salicyl-AMP ligase n=1 Tax=Ruminiclostridium sufflavum DSM 19573 TaxID=1121337 RepID=A0A318YCB8_9FIRM|nr:AMP-binding protein [Ruminiclostridium sufflavum]PYG90252.1 yersiniabactin salicyl-AMP ligase [Ruminiclostridium sufflavum DSM 19573]
MQNKRYIKKLEQYEGLEGWNRMPLGRQLEIWADGYGDNTAVSDENGEITYRELNEKAEKMAYGFLDRGIGNGKKVLVQLPNRISFVIAAFALAKAGAVPIMALPAHREAELSGIMELARPVAYITADKYLGYDYMPMAKMLEEKYDFLEHVIIDGKQENKEELTAIEGEKRELPEVDGYSTAFLLLSGGTTGIPKLIPRTHADYLYNARMSAKRCRMNENSVYLASLPVAHNFPLCCPGLLGTLDKGGKVVLCANTSPDEILSLITEEKVTITALVPAMVTVCMEMLELDEEYDISSLKILQVGGALLEDTLADRIIAEWPCKLMQVFGTAEGLLCFTGLEDSDGIVARCQGTPVSPADEIRIVDESGKEVKDGEYGELLSRGPYTIDAYYMADEANETSFTSDGFYRTGDRAMRTGEGNLRMGGRIKEQINRAGEKILPAEIEAYLCRYGKIKEAAVVGVKDEVLGNRSCAFILAEDGESLELGEIHRYLQELGVAAYKYPDQLEILEFWPLTSVGKIDKKVLADMAVSNK